MNAYVMNPGSAEWRAVSVNTLKDMQALVGGYIEAVAVDPEDRFSIYVNEEGKLDGLEPCAVWMVDGVPYDVLVGPIVLRGPVDADGDDTIAYPIMRKWAAENLAYFLTPSPVGAER